MLHVAIVEDNAQDAEHLLSLLRRFAQKNHLEIETVRFENPLLFLQGYKGDLDIVFMDIDMPMMSGMEAARSLRKIDNHVMLIFVTALARFALNGYEVDAYDFIVKPVQENFFNSKMSRALKKLSAEQRTRLLIRSGDKTIRVYTDEVVYVDIYNHVLSFHTENNGVISTRGTMKDVQESLDSSTFVMCNKSCVVNMRHIQMISGDEVVMSSGERLSVSRPRKTEFMQQIANYYGNQKINMGRF